MSVFDRLFGRGAQAAATELAGAADAAAAELTALMCVDIARARAAALLLAKLCFDRAATPGHGHGPLKAASEASAILYPAIANAMSIDAATAGRHYIELADVVRRRLESRPPAVAGAQIVAEELARAVSASQSELMLSPALIGRVDALIKSFNAILARRLGVPAPRTEGRHMDVDPMEMVESKDDAAVDRSRVRLGARVAVTVALLATFLGICKVKDDNIVQAMQQAQADKLDRWNFYQARNIREEVASAALVQLRLSMAGAAASQQAGYRDAVAKYEAIVADQSKKKEELRLQAGEEQQTYDNLNYRDDQFDLSDTMIALAISLLAMTALTHKKWLYWVAILATLGGVVMGLSGLLGWHVHPDAISKLLS